MLKNLFEGFNTNLKKLKEVVEVQKMSDILQKFCREYGEYSFEVIQLNPIFDGHIAQKFGNPNPIIIFNENKRECDEINLMKSKVLQFLSFITQM